MGKVVRFGSDLVVVVNLVVDFGTVILSDPRQKI